MKWYEKLESIITEDISLSNIINYFKTEKNTGYHDLLTEIEFSEINITPERFLDFKLDYCKSKKQLIKEVRKWADNAEFFEVFKETCEVKSLK